MSGAHNRRVSHHAPRAARLPNGRGGVRIAAGTDDHDHEIRVCHVRKQLRDIVLVGSVQIDRPDHTSGRRLRLDAELSHTVAGSTPGCAMSASRAASLND